MVREKIWGTGYSSCVVSTALGVGRSCWVSRCFFTIKKPLGSILNLTAHLMNKARAKKHPILIQWWVSLNS